MPGGQHAPELTSPDEIKLWEMLCAHQGEAFTPSGRGNRAGVEFKYELKGAEMFVTNRSKSITRSTILYAFHKVQKMDIIPGPKAIGVHGDSYIYAVFKALGVINGDNHSTPGRSHSTPSHNHTPEKGNDAENSSPGTTPVLDSHDMIETNKAKEAIPMPRPKGS